MNNVSIVPSTSVLVVGAIQGQPCAAIYVSSHCTILNVKGCLGSKTHSPYFHCNQQTTSSGACAALDINYLDVGTDKGVSKKKFIFHHYNKRTS